MKIGDIGFGFLVVRGEEEEEIKNDYSISALDE